MNQQDNDTPFFARGIRGPLGKLDQDAKTKLDEHTMELARRKAAMQGTDISGALRDLAYLWVHGKTYSQMVAEVLTHDAERTAALSKLIGTFQGPESKGAL